MIHFFFAVRAASSRVHILVHDADGSPALCGGTPEGRWARTWPQDVALDPRPIGICIPCAERARLFGGARIKHAATPATAIGIEPA